MKLKCSINGVEYDIVQGATFAEEYNETLDSGSIIVDQVGKIEDLKPYDDVFVYAGTFNGYSNDETINVTIDASSEVVSNSVKLYIPANVTDYTWSSSYFRISYIRSDYSRTYDVVYSLSYDSQTDTLTLTYNLLKTPLVSSALIVLGKLPGSLTLTHDSLNERFDCTIGTSGIEDARFVKSEITVNFSDSPLMPSFYKHMLVDQFTEEQINLSKNLYKYKIELFSETKKLETIQLPNISITQPLNITKKTSVYDYLVQFVDLYSPVVKIATNPDSKIWNYKKKYSVDPSLAAVFANVYSPDFSLNNPTLKDVLTQLMLTRDMIPYVQDDQIKALDITARNGLFDVNLNRINYVSGSRSSDNHCDNLKRTYDNALSQDNSCRMVEYLGFRNSTNGLMTLDNMRLETRFPIYKINKIYMCYYKKGKILVNDADTSQRKIFLCKQDITPLVKLDEERNLLSQDWNEFSTQPSTMEELANYKLCTVGYSIGGKSIEGWGTKYNYPSGWWDFNRTYIENILKIVDDLNPYGIYQYGYMAKLGNLEDTEVFSTSGMSIEDKVINPFSNVSLFFKSLFFIVDYNAFYNGTVVHSKDFGRDEITTNDNSSSSLTILELDGLFQKEKANRFGNKAIQINARYETANQLQPLGCVYESGNETDVIIYHREYSVFDNTINCVYYGTKDYVLKNYFTNVYARHRTYNLMSYSDSVIRAENRKMYFLLSKDKLYFENENAQFEFSDFPNGNDYISEFFSFFKPSKTPESIDFFEDPSKLNNGQLVRSEEVGGNTVKHYYAGDVNEFVSGYSICFNMQMYDNVSGGVYISDLEPLDGKNVEEWNGSAWVSHAWNSIISNFYTKNVEDDYTGSVQSWLINVDDVETGSIASLGFEFSHAELADYFYDNRIIDGANESEITNNVFPRIFGLPSCDFILDSAKTSKISGTYDLHKDNKEVIDMTFQIEPITNSEDVLFSQWMMKLSDLISSSRKFTEDTEVTDIYGWEYLQQAICSTYWKYGIGDLPDVYYPLMVISFDTTTFNALNRNLTYSFFANFAYPERRSGWDGFYAKSIVEYYFVAKSITSITDDYIWVSGNETVVVKKAFFGATETYTKPKLVKFAKISSLGNSYTVPTGKTQFANMQISAGGNVTWAEETNKPSYRTGGVTISDTSFNATNNKEFTIDDSLSSSTAVIENVPLTSNANETKQYLKNLYLISSTESMDKTLVYREYPYGNSMFSSSLDVDSVLEVGSDEYSRKYIQLNLSGIDSSKKSIQLWFLDNILYNRTIVNGQGQWSSDTSKASFKFVFGVNLTSEDFERGYVRIYVSLLSQKDTRVYSLRHILVGNVRNFATDEAADQFNTNQYYDELED